MSARTLTAAVVPDDGRNERGRTTLRGSSRVRTDHAIKLRRADKVVHGRPVTSSGTAVKSGGDAYNQHTCQWPALLSHC